MTTDATALAKIGEWTSICNDKPEVLVQELAELGFAVVRCPEWRDPNDAPLETRFLVKATIFADPGYTDEETDIFIGHRHASGSWIVRCGGSSRSYRVLGWFPIPRSLRKGMPA